MLDLTNVKLGRYKLVERLGSTEVTSVYKAFDIQLERYVSLKLINRSQEYSSDFVSYFMNEARTLAQLSHSNIVKLLDYGQDKGYLFLVMEYTAGATLAPHIGQTMDWRQASDWVIPLAKALNYAHDHNIIHRDVQPSNILITADGQPILTDFSVARIIEAEETREMTGTHVGLGSPHYMSPEQGRGLQVDFRADIYSLGVIFFELVTGRKPFNAKNGMEVVIQQVTQPPPSPRMFNPALPEPVEKLILTALQKDPDDRFQDMEEFITALEEVLNSGKYRSRQRHLSLPGVRIGLGAAALLALIATGLFWRGSPQPEPITQAQITVTAAPTIVVSSATAASPRATSIPASISEDPQPDMNEETEAVEGDLFPAFPLLPGKDLPRANAAISKENLSDLVEVALWGSPRIQQMAWSRDGSTLIGATSAGIYFYDVKTLEYQSFFHAGGWLTHLEVSSDESIIAAADRAAQISIWDAKTAERKALLLGHQDTITSMDISPDGSQLVSSSEDGVVKVWDIAAGQELYSTRLHADRVNAVLFSPNGRMIYSGAEDFKVIQMDAESGERLDVFTSSARIYNLAITTTGDRLAVARRDGSVEVWDLAGKLIQRVVTDREQVKPVRSLSFSPNNQLLAVGWDDGIVAVWNVESGVQIMKINPALTPGSPNSSDPVLTVAFSNDGIRLLTHTASGSVIIWNMNTQNNLIGKDLSWSNPTRLNASPNSAWIAVELNQEMVSVRAALNAAQARLYEGRLPLGNAFSPNGKLFAVQNKDKIQLYDFSRSDSSAMVVLHGLPVNARFGFLPGSDIAVASTLRNLVLWSTGSGLQLEKDNYSLLANCQVAYNGIGTFMAAGSNVGFFMGEDTAAFLCSKALHTRAVDIAFVEGGRFAAIGLQNGQVELWNTASGPADYLSPGGGAVDAVALTPDTRLLFSGGEDGKVTVWDTSTREIIRVLENHTGRINDVVVLANGKYIATCSEDGTIQIWAIVSQ
jgi:eukaryotic-like serine/threonine-protein kinase